MTTPTKPYHHGNLREALLDAAQELIAEHGAQALTLREVAKAAAVSHAAPYHHFDSLEALMAAVGERGFAMLAQRMSEAERSGTRKKAPKQRLLGICEAYVAFAQAHPETFRLMFGPLLARKREHPALQQAAERAFDVLLVAAIDHAKSVGKAKEGPSSRCRAGAWRTASRTWPSTVPSTRCRSWCPTGARWRGGSASDC